MFPVPPPPPSPTQVIMEEKDTAADAPALRAAAAEAPTMEQFRAAAARASLEAERNKKATSAVREAMSGDTPINGLPTRLLNNTRGFKTKTKS